MNRRPSSFRSLAVAASGDSAAAATATAMSLRPYLRGGRRQGSRGFSDRSLDSISGDFVSGDSHFGAVRAANSCFRPRYNAVPLPPHYGTSQEFYGPVSQPHRPGPPVSQQGPQPRPYRHPQQVGPGFGNYQPFRPQQMRPQFRPRPSKPPDYRDWEYAKQGPPPRCELFTVLSYNILADYLATDHRQKLYFHIPRYIMDWNRRKRNICFELGLWSADILCFQEVDRFQDLEAELNFRGYNGIWKMRTGDPIDGCAVFWRVSRFKLLHEESIEYNKFGLRDNVAQICVFESQKELNNSTGASTLSTSSACSNRVVVCNIHVLFNPKRGDIKLGQIRLLLEKAHAVSKLWNDAPVVICGDFNCTPQSPMYNFIREQKLDLSELPRDKISGQASAEMHSPRPPYPDYRKEANDSIPTSEVSFGKPEQGDVLLDAQKLAVHCSSTESSSMANYSISESSVVDKTSASCIGEESGSRRASLTRNYTTYSVASENMSTQTPLQTPQRSLGSAQNDARPLICPPESNDRDPLLESSSVDTKATEVGERVESNLQSSSKTSDNQIKSSSFPGNHSSDFARASDSTRAYSSDTSKVEETSEALSPRSPDFVFSKHEETVSVSTDNHDKPSTESFQESLSADFTLDEKLELLSLNESVDGTRNELCEDRETVLSVLHNSGEGSSSDDSDSRSSNQKLPSNTNLILNDTLHGEKEIIGDARNSFSSSSSWTPEEIKIATGSADCKVVEHPLELKSAYTEVESSPGLRDSNGEPLVTSYHRRFSGTVDYIWCSRGLQTKKVLAPIPEGVMHQTQGFPTKKWGSDHIALVAELAFTRDTSSEKASQS